MSHKASYHVSARPAAAWRARVQTTLETSTYSPSPTLTARTRHAMPKPSLAESLTQAPSRTTVRLRTDGYVDQQKQLITGRQRELTTGQLLLLGFEEDGVLWDRPKAYIRRLWLPFESRAGQHTPKLWLDPKVEEFAKEVQKLIIEFHNDAALYQQDTVAIEGDSIEERGLFEHIVDHILVAREWGDNIWGHRKFCRANLVNTSRQEGETCPKWPQDRDR